MEKYLRGVHCALLGGRWGFLVDADAGIGSGIAGELCQGGGFFSWCGKCARVAVVVAEFFAGNESGDGLGIYVFKCGHVGCRASFWFPGGFESRGGLLPPGWRGRDVFFSEALECERVGGLDRRGAVFAEPLGAHAGGGV